jgi:predicted amidophosphoribosyltransferase
MALMQCPECGADVSSAAPSCPSCGLPFAPQVTHTGEPSAFALTKNCLGCLAVLVGIPIAIVLWSLVYGR